MKLPCHFTNRFLHFLARRQRSCLDIQGVKRRDTTLKCSWTLPLPRIMILVSLFLSNRKDLLNYLETGTKKVIGTGRQIFGKKKNDEKFPIYLSVSEVKGVGYQFFTGIINDLTEEIAKKNAIKAEEDRKKMETQKMLDSLAVYTDRSTKLLEQLLPEDFASRIMKGETPQPRSYDTCTIFFSDIVGFTSIAGAASAMEVVDLLNDLYTYFDAVIDRYDCYKVETIGDAYNVSLRVC